ncbi:hypothetical protein Y032_0872g2802 [Ancylostoma ceylanicum]|nr:hypothetical protein Y032_0872g2802 [Ancylostoma ceylanicum]
MHRRPEVMIALRNGSTVARGVAVYYSLHLDPELLLCTAKLCFRQDYSYLFSTIPATTESPPISTITTETISINSTTALHTSYTHAEAANTLEVEALFALFERSLNLTIERNQESEECHLVWTLILTTVFFAFFAVVASYESVAMMMCGKGPNKSSKTSLSTTKI